MAPRHLRARASSVSNGGFLVGTLFGPALGAAVLGISIRAPFFLYSITVSIAAVISILFLSSKRTTPEDQPDSTSNVKSHLRLIDGFRHAGYRAAFTVSLLIGFAFLGIRQTAVPIYVTEELKESASLVAPMSSLLHRHRKFLFCCQQVNMPTPRAGEVRW